MAFGQAQFFPASYDTATKITTAVLCAIVIVATIGTGSPIVAGIGALILGSAYAWSPRGYTIAGRAILVKRPVGAARLPLEGVREARAATSDDFRGCIRLWGDGGLFGYYGLFRTSKLGKSTWYLTNRGNAVVLVTEAKTALFSPDDRDGFLAAIRSTAAVPPGPAAGSPLIDDRHFAIGPLFGLGITVIVVAIGVFISMYSPGPPGYTLTPASLTIHDRFYPVTVEARNVDLEEIRVIDLRTDTGWQPTARTNGFGNAHYRSGRFRVANGQTVRLYDAGSRRVVLLPPKGKGPAVLLETRDPDAFAAQVRSEWGANR